MVVFSVGIVAILRLTFASGGSESRDSEENRIPDASATESVSVRVVLYSRDANAVFNSISRPLVVPALINGGVSGWAVNDIVARRSQNSEPSALIL